VARPVRAIPPGVALDGLGGGWDAEAAGILAGRPLLALDLGTEAMPDGLAVLARRLPAVVVGVRPSEGTSGGLPVPPDLDLLLTDAPAPPAPWVGVPDLDTALANLGDTVEGSAPAAVVLVQLLRLGSSLSVDDGLVAESLSYSLLQAGPAHRAWLAGRPSPRPAPPSPTPVVLVERSGDLLEVRLNRPGVHNAFSAAVRDALVPALQLAAGDPSVRAVEISGVGPSFCSGGDLTEFGLAEDPVLAHLVRTTRSPASWLARVADRTVVRAHGTCVGAGVELAAFAQRVVADPATTFRLPEVGMGLIPGAGGTVSLPRRIGRARTAYLAITGETVDATTARAWGLVDEISGQAR
jgi:hypothetical protein